MSFFTISAITIFVFICFAFLVALLKKRNDVMDIFWGLGFIVVGLVMSLLQTDTNILLFYCQFFW
jgi:Predicted membrane protein